MEPAEQFQALMQEVRAGSPEAMERLINEYGRHILTVIRRKLETAPHLRRRFESQDFLQDVWASFVGILPGDMEFETPKHLYRWLRGVAVHKVVEAVRRVQTQKRDVNRVFSLDGSAALPALTQAGDQPTPSRVVIAREELARLLEGKSEDDQRLILLLGKGCTYEEIAVEMGISHKTVARLVRNLAPEYAS